MIAFLKFSGKVLIPLVVFWIIFLFILFISDYLAKPWAVAFR
jgi:hypothetical protein